MSESVRPGGTYRTHAEQREVLTFPVTAILGLPVFPNTDDAPGDIIGLSPIFLPMPVMARLVGLV